PAIPIRSEVALKKIPNQPKHPAPHQWKAKKGEGGFFLKVA
ncbi:MAG: hypothetical protein ACI8YP_003703, partial [Algoriphagus sp.]